MFVRTDQNRIDVKSDVNEREGMVVIRHSGEAITGIIFCQGIIRLGVEVVFISVRGAYLRI